MTHQWTVWRRELPRTLEGPLDDALHAPPYDGILPPSWIRKTPWDY
jgi:hypothetical protein